MGNVACCQPASDRTLPEVLTAVGLSSRKHRATWAAQARERGLHPIVAAGEDFSSCVKLVNAGALCQLPVPWPRSQDLPQSHFIEPDCDSLVVAVSHGWFYQAHPDPTGAKATVVKSLLDDVTRTHNPPGHTLCFLDFCSIPQRPFRENQSPRSDEEMDRFGTALSCMPNVYLMADAVLHVEVDLPEVSEEEVVTVDAADLGKDTSFLQLGDDVQVCSSNSPKVRLFDIVVSCDYMTRLTAEEVAHKVESANASGRQCPIELRRMPYGMRNSVPVRDRGWIYLERFATMVKAAMVDERDFNRVCFSNSQETLDQIREGSARLREAALKGEESIKRELDLFYCELDQMRFSGTSTDKIMGTALPGTPWSRDSDVQEDDRDVVARIMREMVLELPSLWQEERKRQIQRRLVVAVNGGDAQVVDSLLSAGAEVDYPGKEGETCLHRAALQDTIEVARVLLKHGADPCQQDAHGNCAGHNVFLMMSEHVVDFIDLLLPDPEIMTLKNSRDISPLDRFEAWALTADHNQPYLPAMAYLAYVRNRYPGVGVQREQVSTPTSAMSRCNTLNHQMHEIHISDHTVQVDEWSPDGANAQVHVLWISFGAPVPPCMQRSSLERIARGLRSPFSIKLFAVTRIGGLFRGLSMDQLHEKLLAVLAALPLNRKFIFVDDSKGISLGLLPKLRHRVLGVLSINPHWCVSDEFLQSAGAACTMQHFRGFAQLCGNVKKMAKGLASLALAKDAEAAARNEEQLTRALEQESRDYLDMVAWMCELLAGEWASCMGSLHQQGLARPFKTPSVVACGALAPESVVVRPAMRLQSLFPGSEVSFIANSRVAYQMEDDEQIAAVQDLLGDLLSKLEPRISAYGSERSGVSMRLSEMSF